MYCKYIIFQAYSVVREYENVVSNTGDKVKYIRNK